MPNHKNNPPKNLKPEIIERNFVLVPPDLHDDPLYYHPHYFAKLGLFAPVMPQPAQAYNIPLPVMPPIKQPKQP